MKFVFKITLVFTMLILISGCNSSADKFSLLKKCTVLGDEAILYARAHYVKLFYHFNPEKFSDSFEKVKDFDSETHRNTINTYFRVIEKINREGNSVEDNTTKNLLSSCLKLSMFSTNFVEKNYDLAIKHQSNKNPLTDDFFIEINQIVKFDHNIGTYDQSKMSFKQSVDSYQKAVGNYINHYRKHIPTTFVNQRKIR